MENGPYRVENLDDTPWGMPHGVFWDKTPRSTVRRAQWVIDNEPEVPLETTTRRLAVAPEEIGQLNISCDQLIFLSDIHDSPYLSYLADVYSEKDDELALSLEEKDTFVNDAFDGWYGGNIKNVVKRIQKGWSPYSSNEKDPYDKDVE